MQLNATMNVMGNAGKSMKRTSWRRLHKNVYIWKKL